MTEQQKISCLKCNSLCKSDAKFCGKCGSNISQFCTDCGMNFFDGCICVANKNFQRSSTRTILENVTTAKHMERTSLFKSKMKVKKNINTKLSTKKKLITINVGIMKPDGRGSLRKVRGAWAAIAVEPAANAERVLQLAVEKHSSMDQFFCSFENYVLLYPDLKVCHTLPNDSTENFTIEGYKHFLNKPYSKVCLFICTSSHFLAIGNDTESDEKIEEPYLDYLDEIFPPIEDESLFSCNQNKNNEKLSIVNNDNVRSQSLNIDENEQNIKTNQNENNVNETANNNDLFSSDIEENIFKIICPICQQWFPANTIENHADLCAEGQRKMNIICNRSFEQSNDEDDDFPSLEPAKESQSKDVFILTDDPARSRELLEKIISNCGVDIINMETMRITIFRGSCFNDFHKHFCKPWIQKKDPFCRYEFKFGGEEAIDEGGVSREFFTGIYIYSQLR